MKKLIWYFLFLSTVIVDAQNVFPISGNAQTAKIDGHPLYNGKLEFKNGAFMYMNDYSGIQFPGVGNSISGTDLQIFGKMFMTQNMHIQNGFVDYHSTLGSYIGGLRFGILLRDNQTINPQAGIGYDFNEKKIHVSHSPSYGWNADSTLGIVISSNGNTGIGTLDPTTKLEIDAGSFTINPYGNSGLKLTQLTSSNNPTKGAMPIGVDASGNVVRVDFEGVSSSDRAWLTIGNSDTDESINFLGTLDDESLVIKTNNQERVRISTSGRFIFHNNETSPNNVNNLYLGGGNETASGSNNYANTAVGMGSLKAINANGYRNTAVGSNALRVLTSGKNNVSLGYNAGANVTSGSNNIIIGSSVNAPISASQSHQLNIGNWIYGHNGQIAIGSFTSTLSTVFANNIGYQLIVKNGIKTEKVRVELSSANSWPDYVFNNDYALMSIEQLEDFILKNKHLPNIPSSAEVIKDGIDLGQMDAKLLEKIEELTLYSIELYKENSDLKEKTMLLQKENQEQQTLLAELLKRVEHIEAANK